jgi:hypothetical protein
MSVFVLSGALIQELSELIYLYRIPAI